MDKFAKTISKALYVVAFLILIMGGWYMLTDYADTRLGYYNPEIPEYEQVRGC